MTCPARYAPHLQLPPYSYVSGMWPHPLSDPAGHSFGKLPERITLPAEADWKTCETYLHAVDLFNHGYYWEAHEAWETLWHAAGKAGPAALLFQGLIKLAAAGVKMREGRLSGVARHLARGTELFAAARDTVPHNSPRSWGLDWNELARLCTALVQTQLDPAFTRPAPVVVVWPDDLRLEE